MIQGGLRQRAVEVRSVWRPAQSLGVLDGCLAVFASHPVGPHHDPRFADRALPNRVAPFGSSPVWSSRTDGLPTRLSGCVS